MRMHAHRSSETLDDEALRVAARSSDPALCAYEARWRGRLRASMRKRPRYFHVPGLPNDEVLDAVLLGLVEHVRGADGSRLDLSGSLRGDSEHRANRPLELVLAETTVRDLRHRYRLAATPVDFREVDVQSRTETPEQAVLDREHDTTRELAARRAEAGLDPERRAWLEAFRRSANDGAFFAESGKPNLAAASRVLGRHRSSALRAYVDLGRRFRHARDREDGSESPNQ